MQVIFPRPDGRKMVIFVPDHHRPKAPGHDHAQARQSFLARIEGACGCRARSDAGEGFGSGAHK